MICGQICGLEGKGAEFLDEEFGVFARGCILDWLAVEFYHGDDVFGGYGNEKLIGGVGKGK